MSKRSRALGTYGNFKPRKTFKRSVFKFIKIALLVFLVYQFITVFIVSSFQVQTSSMEPGIIKNQRVLSSSLSTGTSLNLIDIRIPGLHEPHRGDIILARPGNAEKIKWYFIIIDPMVRFFTLQTRSILPSDGQYWNNQISIKRMIAIPGDTVKMIDFKFFIKPEAESVYYAEDSIITKKYSLEIPKDLPKQDPLIPFAGNMKEIKLKENEYFVANDNRVVFYDSRFYGPLKRDHILGYVFLGYWPGLSFK